MSVPILTMCAIAVAFAFGVLTELLERAEARTRAARRETGRS